MQSECMPWRTLARVQLAPSSGLIMTPWPIVPTRMVPCVAMAPPPDVPVTIPPSIPRRPRGMTAAGDGSRVGFARIPEEEDTRSMAYDLLIKNGRIIDGSGRPGFHRDVGVVRGKNADSVRPDGPCG